jgi:polyphenol oxidase
VNLDVISVATPAGVTAAFTTRVGGVSTGSWAGLNLGVATGDDPDAVRENRRRLCLAVGVDPVGATLGHQVHGTDVRTVARPPYPGRFTGALAGWDEGDGLATEQAGIALVVLGADCLPVLLWRQDRPQVAAVHAGWRGLADGVLENAVRALGEATQVGAAIGPGVGPCCYPVDAALRTRFADRFGAATVHGDAVDLALAAEVALTAAGITRIAKVGECTSCTPERFYSYRRDGAHTGRHGGIIAIGAA